MIGLALEGGGAKGSYQAGAYMALKKCHIKIDAVCGTSIGALNGALIASHDEEVMVSLWKDASMSEILGIDEEKGMEILKGKFSIDNIKWTFKEIYKIFKNKGMDISNYRAIIRNNVDESKVRKSNIRFGLTTVREKNYEPIELFIDEIPDGELHDYILASSYLPIFKKEKLVDDEYFLDGGFYNLCPTDMLENIGCDVIYTINIKGVGIRKKNKYSRSKIIEIKPHGNLGSIVLFDRETNIRNMKYGYLDTMKVFDKLDGNRFYFKKRSDMYFKRLNHKVHSDLYDAVSVLLNAKNDKEMVIKALEYALDREGMDDINIYKVNHLIKYFKNRNSEHIIYRYINSLRVL